MMRWELNKRCVLQFLNEPSFALFRLHGFLCLMQRGFSSCWCGYVAIEPNHPLYGKHYNDKVVVPDVNKVQNNGNVIGLLMVMLAPGEAQAGILPIDMAIDVHCGLTYANSRAPNISEDIFPGLWWFGFDCAHARDLHPIISIYGDPILDRVDPIAEYRNYDFARGEVKKLAEQLAGFLPISVKEVKE